MSPPLLVPSVARTVAVVTPSGAYLRGTRAGSSQLFWPDKASAECLDFSLDLTAWLLDAGSDSIAGNVVCAASPVGTASDLILSATTTVSTGLATLFISGGQPEVEYCISFLVNTAGGRTALFDVALRINDATT